MPNISEKKQKNCLREALQIIHSGMRNNIFKSGGDPQKSKCTLGNGNSSEKHSCSPLYDLSHLAIDDNEINFHSLVYLSNQK